MNKKDSELISNTLESNQKDILSVSSIEKNNPKIKIIDVPATMDVTQPWTKLHNDIIPRNDLEESDFKIVFSFKQRNGNYSVIAEVSPVAYDKIMRYKSIFVGYINCKVFDDYNDRNCKKCCG